MGIWILLIAWFSVIMGFVSRSNADVLCSQIVIQISDSSQVSFINSDAVRNVIKNSGINTQGYPVEEIQTRELERLLEKNPYVQNAEVYIDVEGDLFVDIAQRKPLIRIMPGGKQGYYIDQDAFILPLSDSYSPMVLLLTGKIAFPEYVDENGKRRADIASSIELRELLDFAGYVQEHEFWNTQIVQLYRSARGEYEIIPRVGAHQIQFGNMDDYEQKLMNLKLLYDQGLKQYGWNKYDKINLKYSNQIICTKR
jgi:cell division protein FtsQ